MDFELSDDQELLRTTVRRFLDEHAPPAWVRATFDGDADAAHVDDGVWRGLADLGVVGTLVPTSSGGAGGTMVDLGVVLEELGRAVHPGPFLASALATVSAVLAVATSEQQAELLPGLADGSRVGTLAVFEPERRFAWRTPATIAARASEGWVVSGTKAWVPEPVAADLVVVSAAVDEGIALVAVDAAAPGVEIVETPTVDPTRRWGVMTLTEAPARRLGSGDATAALAGVLDRVVLGLVVDGVGAAGRVLDLAVAYAKERVQFDRPIGSFQAVQHLCADMLHDLELARAGVYYGLWAADAAPPDELHRAATMAKAFASDALAGIGASAIQVFGGVGFTWEHDAHLFYKRLLTLQHAYGGTAEHLEELARLVLP